MPQVAGGRDDYTGFMINRTAFAALALLLGSPAFAGETKTALRDAQGMSAGGAVLSAGYDGCPNGQCTVDAIPDCPGGTCKIDRTADAAAKRGGLFMAKTKPRSAMSAEVPAPKLTADKAGAKSKKGGGFFDGMFSGKGLMYGLGGGAAGAGIGFLLGGPIGALIGGLVGAVGGFLLTKIL